jgi:hypothetical protein
MNTNAHNNFNTETLLNEINDVIKKGLNNILKNYMDRYNLLEKTHKQIMMLPSVVNEINENTNYESDENNESDTNKNSQEDEPIFVSITEMTKGIVNEEIKLVEQKIVSLEKKYDSIILNFEKMFEKMSLLSSEIKEINKSSVKENNHNLSEKACRPSEL